MQYNWQCDPPCDNTACSFDFGMCSPPPPQSKPPPTPPGRPPPSPPPLCHEGCLPNMRGDDFCNNACNSAACDWDDGDCDATAPRLPPSPTHPPGFAPRPPATAAHAAGE